MDLAPPKPLTYDHNSLGSFGGGVEAKRGISGKPLLRD